jgi:UDP-N-acetylglucosamine 2-epimerase (non-hydrolysing)
MKIIVVLGTRPEIIKLYSVIAEIMKTKNDFVFIHTGQHYDFMMSDIFFKEMKLKKPDYFLNIKASSQGVQTGRIIAECEKILKEEKPDIVLVLGDTNSALGAAIATSKLSSSLGHIEAGCRVYDKQMSEEINRVLISDISNLHFTPTYNCTKNLLREGITRSQIFLTGHPLVDLIELVKNRKIANNNIEKLKVMDKGYALATIHRRENIENLGRISNIISALKQLSQNLPIVFPCHPHTQQQITEFGLSTTSKKLKLIQPVSYFESLNLIKHAKIVLTDSGGIQQESAILGAPCVTLREATEWVETVKSRVNFLAGFESQRIIQITRHIERNYEDILQRFIATKDIFGKIGASRRIIDAIEKNTPDSAAKLLTK